VGKTVSKSRIRDREDSEYSFNDVRKKKKEQSQIRNLKHYNYNEIVDIYENNVNSFSKKNRKSI
jgi:hypothetical protein